jgi:uncharacterized protein
MSKQDKYKVLQEYLKSLGSVAVAFSSGVDSTFLLKAAYDALGDKVIALTARSCSFPERELQEAINFTKDLHVPHEIFDSEELKNKEFSENPANRCYICKREIFSKMKEIADKMGMKEVIEGSNIDDLGDYRPGLAAIEELGIKSPLRYAGLAKNEIRELSKDLGLETWDKQSFACLASRIPYGQRITEEKLKMVDEAEQLLLSMGFRQVRVRHHENLARIEINESQFPLIMKKETRELIYNRCREIGFIYVSIDLLGYRTGSMNETLDV